jgi:hypothetical protein
LVYNKKKIFSQKNNKKNQENNKTLLYTHITNKNSRLAAKALEQQRIFAAVKVCIKSKQTFQKID